MEPQKHREGMSAGEIANALDLVRAGNADAWGQLYREYAPAIFRFCRRALPTREDAEDATTEIFMKVREKIGQYDASRPFTAWLYKVAANHCWDTLRRRHIRQDLETGDLETLPLEHPDPNQLEQIVAQRTSRDMRRALAHTKPCWRLGASANAQTQYYILALRLAPLRLWMCYIRLLVCLSMYK